MEEKKPFRVLCLDGGGMRGAYQTAYLATFADRISEKLKLQGPLDVGSAFDLVVGTSTGGIVACGLAAGVPLTQMQELYAMAGKKIFPLQWIRPLPIFGKLVRAFGIGTICGDRALRKTLTDTLGDRTIGSVYDDRRIALAVPTLDLGPVNTTSTHQLRARS